MAHDPVSAHATREAANLEPRFVFPMHEEVAEARLEAMRAEGRRPNVLFVLFDDVGWGDFGCYGGGVAVGAPTPHIDALARRGMILTSAYSEPSCTPTRASLMTGRLPVRHGLLRPPMYGEPGGLEGEITLAELLSRAGYVTQAVGKWHMGENGASQPQHCGFDDFYGFLSVSDMYTEWRDPYFFPEIVYSEERTEWIKNLPFSKCFVHAERGGELEEVAEVTIPVLSELDEMWCTYSLEFIRRMADDDRPWFLYHNTRGAHFDNYPHPRFLGTSPAKHPYKDSVVELDDIVGRLVAELEATVQLEDTFIIVTSDNGPEMETWPDAGWSPFRAAKGSTWEGGQRVPAVVAWPGTIAADRVSDGLFSLMDLFPTCLRFAGALDHRPDDRYIDGVDQTSFLLDPDAPSNRKHVFYWLQGVFSAMRVGEWKFMVASTTDDDTDVLNLGGFTGVTQRYTYGRLFNLYLDPGETRSYLIRKLPYLDALAEGVGGHLRTFGKFPPKVPISLIAEGLVRHGLSVPNFAEPDRLVAIAAAAEAGGWDGLFLWDHIVGGLGWDAPISEPWTTLAAVATATTSLRLGTLVTPLPRRRPWVLARQVTTVDHLSRGRAVLGVGLGVPVDAEYDALGEPTDRRHHARLLDDGLSVLDALWSGDVVEHDGPEHHVHGVRFRPVPRQRPRPPVWVAATLPARAGVRRAARWDGVVPMVGVDHDVRPATPDEVAGVVAEVASLRGSLDGFDVVVWAIDPDAAEQAAYAEAGATWLIAGPAPGPDWVDDATAMATEGPPAG